MKFRRYFKGKWTYRRFEGIRGGLAYLDEVYRYYAASRTSALGDMKPPEGY